MKNARVSLDLDVDSVYQRGGHASAQSAEAR
jgi:hypothetical protein